MLCTGIAGSIPARGRIVVPGNSRLRPCHTIAYRTSVCQRMKNITHTPVYATGFKIKISNFEIFVGFFVYVNFLPAVFIFDNESVSVRR